MIPCYKEYGTSFIWYYYRYHISKAILDLDPDLCQNFLFFLTLSILHIEACIIPLRKAVFKGWISFLTPKSFEQFMGTLWPENWEKADFLLVIVSFLLIESSVIPALKAFMKASFLLPTLMSYEQYMRTLWPKSIKIWWFNRALCSLIRLSALRDLSLKLWANKHMLTFKVKVKVKLESFYSCLQL